MEALFGIAGLVCIAIAIVSLWTRPFFSRTGAGPLLLLALVLILVYDGLGAGDGKIEFKKSSPKVI